MHATSGVSTALNVAGVIRALAFQPLHRSPGLEASEKRRIDERVGTATTYLYLGQSIDIGWQDGWYRGIGEYPYEQMAEWKTGAMFGCAAWISAFMSGAPGAVVDSADRFGTKAGVLYQLVDDYLDTFGPDGVLLRPALEDLHNGKPTWPLIALCRALRAQGKQETANLVVERLSEPDTRNADWSWLLALADELGIAKSLRQDLDGHAHELAFKPGGSLRAVVPLRGSSRLFKFFCGPRRSRHHWMGDFEWPFPRVSDSSYGPFLSWHASCAISR